MSLTANYEMNQRRRNAIKPQFKAEFAKGLCSATNPADEFLFGGDTSFSPLFDRGTQRQFSENICSEDNLRSRIFGTFVVKFLACLPVLGFSKS